MTTIVTRASKGSALSWTEADNNITNLNTDKIENVVEDTSPQLGGNLDVNGNSIVSTSNADINITPNGTGKVVISGQKFPGSGTPITGTVTDVDAVRNPNTLTLSNTAGINMDDIITFSGTGVTSIGLSTSVSYKIFANIGGGAFELGLASGGGTISITDPGTITDVNYSVAGATATNGQILTYNSTGLTWANAPAGGIATVSADTNPQLGGNLNVNSFNITNTSGDNKVSISNIKYPNTNGSSGQVLQTDGAGNANWTTPAGGGAATLDDLSDVVITAAATNDVLVYNGTNWVDTAANTLTVSAASTATTATNITVTQVSTSATYYPLMSTTNGTGDKAPVLGTNFTMNPSTGALTAVSLTTSGSITPNSTGGPNINFGTSTLTANAWTTLGISLRQQARNYVDASSTGTVAVSAINGFGISTLNSSNAITVTEASTFYIQPPAATGNTTITTAYGLISTGRIKASDFVGTVGATTASTGAFTTLSASSTVSGTGFSTYLASPPAIGGTTAAAGRFTALTTTNTTASIVSESNGNIAIQPNGTGQTLVKNLEYNENVFAIGTTSGTITPDVANGNVQTITLNGNLTFSAFANPISGQSLTLIITTGGTGRTLTSTMLFSGGSKTLSTTSTVDILTVSYIGTTYYASLGKDFK